MIPAAFGGRGLTLRRGSENPFFACKGRLGRSGKVKKGGGGPTTDLELKHAISKGDTVKGGTYGFPRRWRKELWGGRARIAKRVPL